LGRGVSLGGIALYSSSILSESIGTAARHENICELDIIQDDIGFCVDTAVQPTTTFVVAAAPMDRGYVLAVCIFV
jgi:hypothetical protein